MRQRRAHGVEGDVRQRYVAPGRLVDEDHLLDLAPAVAAELLRPADAEPAVLAHLAHDVLVLRPHAPSPSASGGPSGSSCLK